MPAIQITCDGKWTELPDDKLATVQKAVGGWVELVRLGPNLILLVNDLFFNEVFGEVKPGLPESLPPNPVASALAGTLLVGPVVLISDFEWWK